MTATFTTYSLKHYLIIYSKNKSNIIYFETTEELKILTVNFNNMY